MYLNFFGLAEKPFSITPDPRYLYLSTRHADALAHLLYGINEAGGFIQLTGEVGTGKTTTIRTLLAQAPKDAEIALILNPRLSASGGSRAMTPRTWWICSTATCCVRTPPAAAWF